MFIQTENTPNPNAIKFLVGSAVSPDNPVHFSNVDKAKGKSLLACNLFNINAVKEVFFGRDFITVTKNIDDNWEVIKPEILMAIMDYFVSGLPVFDVQNNVLPNNLNLAEKSEIEKQIIEIIETRVRPSVAMDGGDIIYKGFEDGIVKLELHGACSGCPSSSLTLKQGVEAMLKHFIPEIISVEAYDSVNH